jgi:hypothetical protein
MLHILQETIGETLVYGWAVQANGSVKMLYQQDPSNRTYYAFFTIRERAEAFTLACEIQTLSRTRRLLVCDVDGLHPTYFTAPSPVTSMLNEHELRCLSGPTLHYLGIF